MSSVIYALVDPRNMKEFYVGKTEDLYRRFGEHIRCEGSNPRKNARIRELRYLELLPIPKTLEIVEDYNLLAEREVFWIRHLRSQRVYLMNNTVHPYDPTERRKQEEAKKRVYITLKELSNISGYNVKTLMGLIYDGRLKRHPYDKDRVYISSVRKLRRYLDGKFVV